jgi:signal transduction histidine kinase
LGELCDIALRTFAPLAAAKQQVIEQVYDPPDIAIESDAQAIVHVVRLLLDNAVKFTPAGGSIRLHVTAETAGACIAIADTGIGMSEEQVAALFRPFQQGDQRLERQYDGLGLSLAYVGEMVARLDGALIVTSALGAGSRFEVRLPWRAAGPLVSENSEK